MGQWPEREDEVFWVSGKGNQESLGFSSSAFGQVFFWPLVCEIYVFGSDKAS